MSFFLRHSSNPSKICYQLTVYHPVAEISRANQQFLSRFFFLFAYQGKPDYPRSIKILPPEFRVLCVVFVFCLKIVSEIFLKQTK